MVQPFLAPVMEATFRIHEQLYASVALDTRANRRIIIAAAGANVVLRSHEEPRHRFSSQVTGHDKMSDLMSTQILDFTRAISLVSISGY